MSDDNNNGRNGRQPLTLKPRPAGSVSSGTVKQSFSHGRTKTVVVETKRARPHASGAGNLAAPSAAERRHFDPKPAASPSSQAPRAPQSPQSSLFNLRNGDFYMGVPVPEVRPVLGTTERVRMGADNRGSELRFPVVRVTF